MTDPIEEHFVRLGQTPVGRAVFDDLHMHARQTAKSTRRKMVIIGAAASVLLVATTGAIATAMPLSDRLQEPGASQASRVPSPSNTPGNAEPSMPDADCTQPPEQTASIRLLDNVESIRFCPLEGDQGAAITPPVALTSNFAPVLAAIATIARRPDPTLFPCPLQGSYRIQVSYTYGTSRVLKFEAGCNTPYTALMAAIARQEAQGVTRADTADLECPSGAMPRGSQAPTLSVPETAPFPQPELARLPAVNGMICRYDSGGVRSEHLNAASAEQLRIALLASRTSKAFPPESSLGPVRGPILMIQIADGDVYTVRVTESARPSAAIEPFYFGEISRDFVDRLP